MTIRFLPLLYTKLALSTGLFFFLSEKGFVNFEVGFFSAVFVLLASFYSYKRLVHKRLEAGGGAHLRDDIEKIEDVHDLYDEDSEINPQEEFTAAEIKEIIKDEKKNLKKGNIKNTVRALPAMFSIYRVGAYAFLVVAFLFLVRRQMFDITGYILGIFLGLIFCVVALKLKEKKGHLTLF